MEEADDWVAIGDLVPGQHLHSPDGRSSVVTAVRQFTQVSPVHDLTIDGIHAFYVGSSATSVLAHNCAAKRGPKPAGTGPHNLKIEEVARTITDGAVVAGGGVLPEKAIETVGGYKSSRRPDVLVHRPNGLRYGINVGKQAKSGAPIKRDAQAIWDLEAAGVEMHFVPYN